MMKILSIFLAIIAILHGGIHFMGFVAYWPLAKIDQLPYKTTLLGGHVDLGQAGMRIYSIMWLLAALIFVVAGIALILRASWWAPLMLGGVLLSLVLCSLDWGVAFRGALVDLFSCSYWAWFLVYMCSQRRSRLTPANQVRSRQSHSPKIYHSQSSAFIGKPMAKTFQFTKLLC